MLSDPRVLDDVDSGRPPAPPSAREDFERELEALIGGLPMAYFRLDDDGRLVSYRAGHFWLAFPPERFLGRSVAELFPAPLAQMLGDAIAEAQRSGRARAIEYEMAEGGGLPRHFVGNVAKAHGGGVVVLIQDTTEQLHAQAKQRESERRFRALIERATDVLYVVDAQFVILFWSPGSVEALGWTAEEAVGHTGLEFIHPDDVGLLVPPEKGVQDMGRFTYRVRHRDGSYRVLDAVVRNYLADPAIEGIIVNARDVTEERRREARSAESTKLESIGRLAGGVAHDFNNLLTVILGCAGFVEEALDAGEVPDRQELTEIVEAAKRARDLTQQLLAFARRQVIEPTVLDLNELLMRNERMLRRVLGEDVVLEVVPHPRACRVRCDPTQLQQVVFNLAANARDAMPRGGRLHIGVSALDLDDDAVAALPGLVAGRHVRLTVRDEGSGLEPEIRAHLFEPFFTTKEVGKGTGLGLATVYGIVRQSGGAITVESAAEVGTTFDIYLPCTDDDANGAPKSTRDVSTPPHERILLVEDEAIVGRVAARILRDAGYTVFVVENGREALSIARREHVHLLLTDVIMPGMSGPLVADEIRKIRPEIRVLYVSGYPEETLGRQGVTESRPQFLEKPYSPNRLLARVRAVLLEG